MGLLDDAIREHLELKRRRGADAEEVSRLEQEALGPPQRGEFATAAEAPEPAPAPEAEVAPEADLEPELQAAPEADLEPELQAAPEPEHDPEPDPDPVVAVRA